MPVPDQQLLPTPHPPIKKHPKSLGTGSVCHISTKIYTNSTDPSSVDQNTAKNHSAQESIRPGEGWGPSESMAHHRFTPAWEGGSSSSCPTGSLLIQPTVQVHGNSHGCNLGVARCKSAPLNMQPPSPSQQGFGSQPSMPRAPGGGLDVPREEGSVSGAAPAPWAPQAGPAPPPGTRRGSRAGLSTHLQGSNAGCHAARHPCIGPDVFQDLFETALREATTRVRMARGGDTPTARAQLPPGREVLLLQPRAHSHGEGWRLQGQLSHFSDQILSGEQGKEGKKQKNHPNRQSGARFHAQHQACHPISFRARKT